MSNSILVEDQIEDELQENPETPEEAEVEEPTVPEKYRGKSLEDIIEMHSNAEKEKSRLGNEVSELRKLTDQVLSLKVSPSEPAAPEPDDSPISSDALWENPDAEIRRRVSSLPEVKKTSELEGKLVSIERELLKSKFAAKHPDYEQVLQDEQFADWVKSSPYRVRQLQSADAFDLDAADDLFSTFKAMRGVQKPESTKTPEQGGAEKKRRAALNKATLESGSTGAVGPTIIRRSDLLKMRMNDPDAYYNENFQQELLQAYAEGRVK